MYVKGKMRIYMFSFLLEKKQSATKGKQVIMINEHPM